MAADWEITFDLDAIPPQIEAAVPVALEHAAQLVLAVAKARTPSRDGAAGLRGSAGSSTVGAGFGTVVSVKYPGPYAAFQNRGMRADGTHVIRNRPAGGQTGFLTETMHDQADAARAAMAHAIWGLLG